MQMLAAAEGLARRGHAVWVGSPAGGDLQAACTNADLPFLELPLRSPWDPVSASRLRKHLRRHETDILHVHKGRAHAIGLVAATCLGRRPLLVVNRGVTFPLDIFNKWKFRHPRVSSVVCVADAVRTSVIQSGGFRPDSVHTIHGGTDPDIFDPVHATGESLRLELGIDPDDSVIGQVSVRDWKGWSDLVEAFALLAARSSAARLLLVGCEPETERRKVEAAVREADLSGRVLTLPYRTDMPEVFAACDVVVDASWAGTGITGTIREAMALQRPVVATDCGGNRELVVDGEVGLVVPPQNPEAMATALARLIEDPDLRQRLGSAARRRVVEHFSTEKRIDKLEALYRELVG
ncbi:MAG: glycosyltransferase family 4 protein [Thermoanaerobaculales bacterium]|nr:glycosyltransferase family 4 protein [Thermoanaerobaculales bacterium]